MRAISADEHDSSIPVCAGEKPSLQWLSIKDLVVDLSYQRPIDGRGQATIRSIARSFQWSYFTPVIVAPVENGKFAIIDGQRRATAAAMAGFDSVPCQLVTADPEQQAISRRIISGVGRTTSRMKAHAADLTTSDPSAIRLNAICARAGVELLRYPVPVDRQGPGQTMAVAAMNQCLQRYGEETLITALQCVTQTNNHRPGVLTASMIKSLCAVLSGDHFRRDSGLALLEAFDAIDLAALQRTASTEALRNKIPATQALCQHIRHQLERTFPHNRVGTRRAQSPAPRYSSPAPVLPPFVGKSLERAPRLPRKS